ncbi:hypothetical protein BC938DRAFT_472604 [Jimgerdemannia flammicorona]|uniref:Uncharacterized protein n=1 Tax=Jimgerdemannia flammicorona TaxID=994334 RepID=A0A433QTU6_9FUNG|nr:hypothetical protein BC938DRAFT_472604 [Jimgerdemannia flammicorona]
MGIWQFCRLSLDPPSPLHFTQPLPMRDPPVRHQTHYTYSQDFDLVCDELGIKPPNHLAQLHRIPSNKLIKVIPCIASNSNPKIRWHGTIDGVNIHKEIRTLLNEGDVDPNVLEIIVGNNTDEGTIFVTGIPIAETYHNTLAKAFPTIAGKPRCCTRSPISMIPRSSPLHTSMATAPIWARCGMPRDGSRQLVAR